MREVLIDHARRRAADRRGGGWRRVPLDSIVDYFEAQGLDVVAVHEALDRLAELNERQSQVMTLRYFGGLTVPEVAAALGVSVVTVERDWRLARAWLRGQLRKEAANDAGTLAADRRPVRRRDSARTRPSGATGSARACGDDDDAAREVDRLLDQDERADRDGFLTPPGARTDDPPIDRELAPDAAGPRSSPGPTDLQARPHPGSTDTDGFTPKAVIAAEAGAAPDLREPASVVRARLRELPIIYILIFGMMLCWRHLSCGTHDPTICIAQRDRHRGPRRHRRPALDRAARSRSTGSRPWSWG